MNLNTVSITLQLAIVRQYSFFLEDGHWEGQHASTRTLLARMETATPPNKLCRSLRIAFLFSLPHVLIGSDSFGYPMCCLLPGELPLCEQSRGAVARHVKQV